MNHTTLLDTSLTAPKQYSPNANNRANNDADAFDAIISDMIEKQERRAEEAKRAARKEIAEEVKHKADENDRAKRIETTRAITDAALVNDNASILQLTQLIDSANGQANNAADEALEQLIQDKITTQIQDALNANGKNDLDLNLTPQQIAQLSKDIAAALKGADYASLQDGGKTLVTVSLTPPQAEQTPTQGQAQDTTQAQANAPVDLDTIMEVQNRADKFAQLLKNAANRQHAQEQALAGKSDAKIDSNKPLDFNQHRKTSKKKALSAVNLAGENATAKAKAKQQAAHAKTANNAQITLENAAKTQSPSANAPLQGAGALAALPLTAATDSLAAQTTLAGTPHLVGANALSNLTTQGKTLASKLTQASHASKHHPATKQVAARMHMLNAAGGDKNITLQLDPAELGRVEVRMKITQDNSVTAKIISETPEAHALLQRDAQALEKALQDTGLETQDGALEFALADDNHDFTQDGRHDGSRNEARNPNSSNKAENAEGEVRDIITTTINWSVNHDTGYVSYDLLV